MYRDASFQGGQLIESGTSLVPDSSLRRCVCGLHPHSIKCLACRPAGRPDSPVSAPQPHTCKMDGCCVRELLGSFILGTALFLRGQVTHDLSHLTCADFLRAPGVQTPVIVRFSTVIHERGSPETLRDPRGFAVKFYTREGCVSRARRHLPSRVNDLLDHDTRLT